jgi:transaldolase / glucose-6-phosphate isomerase
VSDALSELIERDAVRKLFAADGSLWSDDPEIAAEIGRWTGWIPVIAEMRSEAAAIQAFAAETMAGFDRVVLCAMGGSSLAPLVLGSAFGGRIHVLDTTDPDAVRQVPVEGSLFVIGSKSGSTLEPEVMEAYFWDATGGDPSRFVAITDPGSKLAARAAARGFRRVFQNRPDIGGRFSALSYFGLVPAALAGIEIAPLLDAAAAVLAASGPGTDPARNAPLHLGAALGAGVRAGRDKLTIVTDPGIGPFGLWLEQLIAESTGKNGTGVVPLAEERLGPPAVYGDDRLFAYLRLDGTNDAAVAALEGAGFDVTRFDLTGPADIGGQMVLWELATAYCGALLNINPFDQPNVQAAKDYVVAALAGYESSGALDAVDAGDVAAALGSAARGRSFVVIQAYVTPSEANARLLQDLRHEIRDALGVATQLGFGPRYLHSTGQLHKGGSRQGVYLQVLSGDSSDAAIPGRPWTFRTVIEAQAIGDAQALRATGQPVARVALRDAAAAVRAALGAR